MSKFNENSKHNLTLSAVFDNEKSALRLQNKTLGMLNLIIESQSNRPKSHKTTKIKQKFPHKRISSNTRSTQKDGKKDAKRITIENKEEEDDDDETDSMAGDSSQNTSDPDAQDDIFTMEDNNSMQRSDCSSEFNSSSIRNMKYHKISENVLKTDTRCNRFNLDGSGHNTINVNNDMKMKKALEDDDYGASEMNSLQKQYKICPKLNNNKRNEDYNGKEEIISKSIHIHHPGGLTAHKTNHNIDLSKNSSCDAASSFGFAKSAPVAIPRPHHRKMIEQEERRPDGEKRLESPEGFMPPHQFIALMNPHKKQQNSSNSRGLSSLLRRTALLDEMGYLDGYTELAQKPMVPPKKPNLTSRSALYDCCYNNGII